MTEPIRILHVFGKLNMGGAETRVMDLYRHIDREKVQFDFLVHYRVSEEDRKKIADLSTEELLKVRPEEDFDREALEMGARIYVLPRFTGQNLGEYRKACRSFFRSHHDWMAVEGHMTSMASVYLPIAKNAGVPVTIAHARSAGVDSGIRGLATRLFRRSLSEKCDIMMSCSRPASISVFGRKAYESGRIMMVPNALDVRMFRFDPEVRRRFRQQRGIPDEALVIGHVGRFDPVKNQKFLAEVGKLLLNDGHSEKDGEQGTEKRILPDDLRFVFAGKGNEMEKVRKAFEAAGLGNHVIFAGQLSREETRDAYQAFDLFAFPSLYEGLPGTVIEAQAAGLPCVIADTITDEVVLTDLVVRLPLDDPDRWAEEIRKRLEKMTETEDAASGRNKASADACRRLDEAGYDIVTQSVRMQNFYLGLAAGGL